MQGNSDTAGLANLVGGGTDTGLGLGGSSFLSGIPGLSGLASLLGGGLTSQTPVRGQFPPQQGFPPQGFPPQQGFPQQGFPQQGFPQQGFPQQGFPQQGFPQQGGFPTGPTGFARPPRGAPPPFQPSPPGGGGFFGFGNRRRSERNKRETSLQGNLIRFDEICCRGQWTLEAKVWW